MANTKSLISKFLASESKRMEFLLAKDLPKWVVKLGAAGESMSVNVGKKTVKVTPSEESAGKWAMVSNKTGKVLRTWDTKPSYDQYVEALKDVKYFSSSEFALTLGLISDVAASQGNFDFTASSDESLSVSLRHPSGSIKFVLSAMVSMATRSGVILSGAGHRVSLPWGTFSKLLRSGYMSSSSIEIEKGIAVIESGYAGKTVTDPFGKVFTVNESHGNCFLSSKQGNISVSASEIYRWVDAGVLRVK